MTAHPIGQRVRVIPKAIKDKHDRALYGDCEGVVVDRSDPKYGPWVAVWLRDFRATRWFRDDDLDSIADPPIVIEHRGAGVVYIKSGESDGQPSSDA